METEGAGPRAQLRERLQAALGGAYTLERELGGGGMSRVFVATETALGRTVVVKVLPPELGPALSAERFRREVRLAARLSHPHIVPLLAAGEAGGVLYYTMPFVAGESLRERLAREGELPVPAAVRVLRDVAAALASAHASGVVHRDLKPENILLAGGEALVTDFGVAKALTAAAGASDDGAAGVAETLTSRGMALGTPAYMAPEQAAADPQVDHRADLYAFGCVAYEVLTGAPPFPGRTPQQTLAAQVREAPESLVQRRPSVPPALAALVMRLLEKRPADRPQSADEVLRTLEAGPTGSVDATPGSAPRTSMWAARRRHSVATLGALAAALLVVAGVLVARRRVTPDAAPAPTRPVLAVLPFENLGPPADAYFADGLTDEVRGRLASVAGLRVIGGTSARQYKGSAKAPREIARELGATHLLTGTVRWERTPDGGGRVRVSPELVRAADQASVWAEPVEGPLGSVFAMQARVAERVAAALDVTLLGRDRRTAPAPPTRNAMAYDAYLRGRAYGPDRNRISAPARQAAAEAYRQAIALDSQFAAAHARLAMIYLEERIFGRDGGMLEKARASVARALALDSTLVESQLAHAQLLMAAGDGEGAFRALQVAARLAPGDVEVVYWTGVAQLDLERLEEAAESFQRAALLEPRWSGPVGQLAGTYDRLFRHEEAIRAREREIALAPHDTWSYVFQAASHLLRQADTAAARRTLLRGEPRSVLDALVRLPLAFAGRAIWLGVVPPATLAAKDTLTYAGYRSSESDAPGTPDLFHLVKARHFAVTGRPERARAHADSIIALLEPALRRGPGALSFAGAFSQRATLAEAYAYAGRAADAARVIDGYVDDTRRGRAVTGLLRPSYALVTAAYVDVLIGRRDLAVTRLAEALRLPSGWVISRALLRADPSWAPLRGHSGFERLIAGG